MNGLQWYSTLVMQERVGAVIADTEPGGGETESVGNFYKALAHVVLMFGAGTWVLTPRMDRALDSFQHRVARRITGRQPSRRGDESCH